jgi:hypothetical protein
MAASTGSVERAALRPCDGEREDAASQEGTSMTVRITGTIRRGQGYASTNYPIMIAAAALHCPAVANCGKYGTINVVLDQPLDKSHADCWTPRIGWRPVVWGGQPYQGEDRPEEFGFIKIKFEYPLDGQSYDAWIILPSGHGASYFDAFLVEIIAAELVGGSRVAYESRCAIHLDHAPSIKRPSSFGDNYVKTNDPGRLW